MVQMPETGALHAGNEAMTVTGLLCTGVAKVLGNTALPEDLFYVNFGSGSARVDTLEATGPARDEAPTAARAFPIDSGVGPTMQPVSAHDAVKQVRSWTEAPLRGDPEGDAIVWHTAERSAA